MKTLKDIAAFLNKSTKCTNFLYGVVKYYISSVAARKWNLNSRLVQTIVMYHTEVFNVNEESPDEKDGETPDTNTIMSNVAPSRPSRSFSLEKYKLVC